MELFCHILSLSFVSKVLYLIKLQTMSVLSVMKNIRSEVDAGSINPYCFVEINGLKLASPENIYKVLLSVKRRLRIHH